MSGAHFAAPPVPVPADLLARLRAHLVNDRQSWIESGSQLERAADGTCRPVPGTLDAEHRDIVTAITVLIEGIDAALDEAAQAYREAADGQAIGPRPMPSLMEAVSLAAGAWAVVGLFGLTLWHMLGGP
jgi:hypothetical protein